MQFNGEKMKTLLVAINAKYEHEGLAVWCLRAACLNMGIKADVRQYSINDSYQRIWASLMEEQPDVLGFSCYIWNRVQILRLISDFKKAMPDCVIIVGGPEVSCEGSEPDFINAGASFVIKGEGEGKLPVLLKALSEGGISKAQQLMKDKEFSQGLSLREDIEYISPFVPEYLNRIRNRIAYIESSRGCPYRCSYCLSSESKGLVLFPVEEVEKDINALVKSGSKVIKFVDRSFNINEEHSLGIWNYIKKFTQDKVTFHFEINPDRLTKAQMECLLTMPAGLIQIEAGIQSVNKRTLKEVSRVMDVEKAIANLKILTEQGNIHVHTDLIAGLPYEDMDSFIESFNRVYYIKAHHLQLGFLKLLYGTRIQREAAKHLYKYREYPPYEVIENKYMSASDILVLKGVEEVLDRTYNSGRLNFTLDFLTGYFNSPFDLYYELADFLKKRDLLYKPLSAVNLFKLVREFAIAIHDIDCFSLDSLIALDYACSLKNPVLPDFLNDSKVKALNPKNYMIPHIVGEWKKEYRKRFLVLSGSFPIKKGDNIQGYRNRMSVDISVKDPVTGRAVVRPV
jgi:radical SAM superfamily enzyme YgiQ (UPF0313 family)